MPGYELSHSSEHPLLDVVWLELVPGAVMQNLLVTHSSSPFPLGLTPLWWLAPLLCSFVPRTDCF